MRRSGNVTDAVDGPVTDAYRLQTSHGRPVGDLPVVWKRGAARRDRVRVVRCRARPPDRLGFRRRRAAAGDRTFRRHRRFHRAGEWLRPDEVKALVGECITRMSRAVEEHGGVVESYMGDGICACFGVPSAHEDDPDRAAEAALAVLATVTAYADDIRQAWGIDEFNVRVGINSGLAAVGAVGAAQPRSVVLGDMTNVAARIQAAADPGTILGRRGHGAPADAAGPLEPVGALSLKGRQAPVPAWRLIGARRRARPDADAAGRQGGRGRDARTGGGRSPRRPRPVAVGARRGGESGSRAWSPSSTPRSARTSPRSRATAG